VGIFLWFWRGGETVIFPCLFGVVGGGRRPGYFRDSGLCLVLWRGAKVKEWKESSTEV